MKRNLMAEANEICDILNSTHYGFALWKVATFTDKYGTVHYSARSTVQLSLAPALTFWKDFKKNTADIAKYLSTEDRIVQILVKHLLKESA